LACSFLFASSNDWELAQSQATSDRQSDNERFSQPPPPFGKVFIVLVILAFAITLVLFIFVSSAVIAIKLTKRLYQFGRKHQFGPIASSLLFLLLLLAVLFSAFALPRQASIVRSWESIVGPIGETSFWSEKLFGARQNRYEIDIWGQVTEIQDSPDGKRGFAPRRSLINQMKKGGFILSE